ncbi:diphthamide biosynthesis protein 2 [Nematocida homosporus]|uniref:diphthamide biosynthesis protein 2 n=1 Tax=Nematocida homosporus TaxID=1912981 RepID=UPI00221EB250|nr:diphthamide biosynthesis protein 2 [Nematocida homosporus]KAI5186827.1 diphthamide biosynthesis protein 2 [Nematocida homosporus]
MMAKLTYFVNQKIDLVAQKDLDVLSEVVGSKLAVQVAKNGIKDGCRIKQEVERAVSEELECVVLADSDRCCVDWVAVTHADADVLLKASFSCPLLNSSRSAKLKRVVRVMQYLPSVQLDCQELLDPKYAGVWSKHWPDLSFYLAVDSHYLAGQIEIAACLTHLMGRPVRLWTYNEEIVKEAAVVVVVAKDPGFIEYFKENYTAAILSAANWTSLSVLESQLQAELTQAELTKTRKMVSKLALAERIQAARTVGIVFTSGDHMALVDIIAKYLDMHQKKFYHFFINGLKPQKLGNFIGVDLFVVIQCPFSSFRFEENIVAVRPYDLLLAFRQHWDGTYTTNLEAAHDQILMEIQAVTDSDTTPTDSETIPTDTKTNPILAQDKSNSESQTSQALQIKSEYNLLRIQPGEVCTQEQAARYFQTGEYLKTLQGLGVPETAEQESLNNTLMEGYSGIPTSYTKGK